MYVGMYVSIRVKIRVKLQKGLFKREVITAKKTSEFLVVQSQIQNSSTD